MTTYYIVLGKWHLSTSYICISTQKLKQPCHDSTVNMWLCNSLQTIHSPNAKYIKTKFCIPVSHDLQTFLTKRMRH